MNKSNTGNISFTLYAFAFMLMIGGAYHAVKQISTYGWETTTGTVLLHRWEKDRMPSQPGYFDKAIVSYT